MRKIKGDDNTTPKHTLQSTVASRHFIGGRGERALISHTPKRVFYYMSPNETKNRKLAYLNAKCKEGGGVFVIQTTLFEER
jgi:hypothetical protein